jgi:hypothetical protein
MVIRLNYYEIGAKILKAALTFSLVISAVIGAYIVSTDSYLWTEAPSHTYGLIAFIVVDLITASALYTLPRLSRILVLFLPVIQFTAMVGDLYLGLGSPGSIVQDSFREYLLNDSAFMILLVLQAVLMGMAFGYLVQRPTVSQLSKTISESKKTLEVSKSP